MFMNLLSLSMTHCPEHLLLEPVQLQRVFTDLADYLGLYPVQQPTLVAVTLDTTPEPEEQRDCTGFVVAPSGYLYLRTWLGTAEPSITLTLGTREEFETARIHAWLTKHFQVEASNVHQHYAVQGMSPPRAPFISTVGETVKIGKGHGEKRHE